MFRRRSCHFLLFLIVILQPLVAEKKSPEQIQRELDASEKEFQIAKEMFYPYYTGPLITASANNVPVGTVVIQPYLFLKANYAGYSSSRKVENITTIYQVNPLFLAQTGINPWIDFTITPQGFFNWQGNQNAQHWGDLGVTLGFQILKEKARIPSIRFTITESFPTGHYRNLNDLRASIDATGTGSFETTFGINFSKILWTDPLHPVSLRLSLNYMIPSTVDVSGFHAFGGGYGAYGKVRPGNTFTGDFSFEYSITQKWVFATDFVYSYANHSSFSGVKGLNADGSEATNTVPSSDQFSLAPAIEYNISESQGFIAGPWFTVTGRNSGAFASLVISYYTSF